MMNESTPFPHDSTGLIPDSEIVTSAAATGGESVLSIVSTQQRPQALISNDVKKVLELTFQISIFIITSLLGVVANIINTTVYWKMGLKDSITLGFFALSVSDLFNVLLPLVTSGCYIAKFSFPNSPVYYTAIHYVSSAWLRQMSYSFSSLIVAFLSIERCCCVILPLKVKLIFTRKRTFIVILALLLFHVAWTVPIFATHQLRWMVDPNRNYTETLRVWFAPNRKEIEAFNYTVMSLVTPTLSQFVLIVSAIIMVRGLIKSAKFKRSATGKSQLGGGGRGGGGGETSTSDQKSREDNSDTNSGAPGVSGNQKQDVTMLSSRDLRLVKAMVFLVAILSACNIPYLSLVYAMLVEPELNIRRAYHNTYSVMFSISIALATVNSSANFLVYLKTSTRYREILGQMFTSCSPSLSKLGE